MNWNSYHNKICKAMCVCKVLLLEPLPVQNIHIEFFLKNFIFHNYFSFVHRFGTLCYQTPPWLFVFLPVGVLMALFVERVALGGVDTLSEDPEGKSSANFRKKKNHLIIFLYKKIYTLQYFFISKEIHNFWLSFFYSCMK